jgi:hypothetical protein
MRSKEGLIVGANIVMLTPPSFTHPTPSYCLSPNFLPPSTATYTTYTLRYTTPASTHFRVLLNGERVGGGGAAEESISGVVVLTRILLEQLETLEESVVIPHLKQGLEWVVEKVATLFH